MFVDNVTDHIKTIFDDCLTTIPNSEGAIDPDKWRNIVQCRWSCMCHEFDDDVNCELADEWLTPNEVQAQS